MTVCMLLEAPQATTGALDPCGPPSVMLFFPMPMPMHLHTRRHNRVISWSWRGGGGGTEAPHLAVGGVAAPNRTQRQPPRVPRCRRRTGSGAPSET